MGHAKWSNGGVPAQRTDPSYACLIYQSHSRGSVGNKGSVRMPCLQEQIKRPDFCMDI